LFGSDTTFSTERAMRVFGVISYFLENVLCMCFIKRRGCDPQKYRTKHTDREKKHVPGRERTKRERRIKQENAHCLRYSIITLWASAYFQCHLTAR